jgi:hypothetical protein
MVDFTHEQLVEMVDGKKTKPIAHFFEKAALDVAASKKAGHRVYNPTVYVQMNQPGVTDSISYPAQKSDIDSYPEEYNHFRVNRQGARRDVMIQIIPGLDIIHMQELIDMGLSTIARLAAAPSVPQHLEYARESAITLDRVLQEQANGNQEKGIEEAGIEEAEFEEIPVPAQNVSEAHRPGNCSTLERSTLPSSVEGRRNNSAERVRESGRINRGEGVKPKPPGIFKPSFPSKDWNISFD